MYNLDNKLVERIEIVNDVSIMNSELLTEIIDAYKEKNGLKNSQIAELFYEDGFSLVKDILETTESPKVNCFHLDTDGEFLKIELYKI